MIDTKGGPTLFEVLLVMFVCFGIFTAVASFASVRSKPIVAVGGGRR